MKFVSKNICMLSALLVAGAVNADEWSEFTPNFGVDYYQTWTRGQGDWKKVFPRTYRGATVYVATRFCQNLGLELGYDMSMRAKKEWSLSGGSAFFNGIVPNTGLTGTTKARRSGVHLDFLGFLPVADCFDLFASVGYGLVQSKVDVTISTISGSNQGSALASVSGKGRSVLRAGVGGSYMVSNMVGLRAKLGWETTSTLRVTGNDAFTSLGYRSKGWKDTTALSIGAFVKF
jgi:hypothetical protein